MTLLGWLWEQDGSLQYRLRKVGLPDHLRKNWIHTVDKCSYNGKWFLLMSINVSTCAHVTLPISRFSHCWHAAILTSRDEAAVSRVQEFPVKKRQAYEMKLEQIEEISRISDEIRPKPNRHQQTSPKSPGFFNIFWHVQGVRLAAGTSLPHDYWTGGLAEVEKSSDSQQRLTGFQGAKLVAKVKASHGSCNSATMCNLSSFDRCFH